MRSRKAERCLQRATSAIEAGAIGDADAALAEARQLDPGHSGLQELSNRLEALKHPFVEPPALRRGWTGVAAAFGLILLSLGAWGVWSYRGQIWTDQRDVSSSRSTIQSDVDVSSGLAAVSSAPVGAASLPGKPPTPVNPPTANLVVNTEIVTPETVAIAPSTPPVSTAAPVDSMTLGGPLSGTTGKRVEPTPSPMPSASDSVAHSSNPPLTLPKAPEPNAPATREVPTPSLSYAAPSTLPSTPSTPIPSFIPSGATPSGGATNRPSAAPSASAPDPAPAAAPPSSAATAAPVPSAAREQSAAVRAALGRYESAYNQLDVAAVRSVWPSIDQRALARAFDSLTSQHVSLQNCTIDIIGGTARANCAGRASWIPRIGGGEQTASRQWTFNLNQADGEWHIVQVQAR